MEQGDCDQAAPSPATVQEHFQPCPFCGIVPNVLHIPDLTTIHRDRPIHVECKSMGCVFKRSRGFVDWQGARDEWNIRIAAYEG